MFSHYFHLQMTISRFLALHQFDFPRFEHCATQTCSEFEARVSNVPGTRNKNLFLRDRKGQRHILVVVPAKLEIDLEQLSMLLGIKRLGFASTDRLRRFLGVESGSVSVLSLIHDQSHAVELVIDQNIWDAEAIQAHPLINTETVVIPQPELKRFLTATGHQPTVMDVPGMQDISLR
jgi:Ala-tRNA(Pro) deacylase